MATEHPSAQAIDPQAVENFIDRWTNTGGTEKANYQLFLGELITLLGLPTPDPAGDDNELNEYVFERRVDIDKPDGTSTRGFIDLYRRGCFVCEAKQSGKTLDSSGWDKAMLAAQNQADQYIRALPQSEGRPPFIVVTDVGRSIELYAEFTRSGGTYVPFPDPGHHRIRLEDLRDPEIRERLIHLWTGPDRLDPSKHAARVTRDVSRRLATLARSLEQSGYAVDRVAHFLKRCLFTMFAEDVKLLPRESFTTLLEKLKDNPEHFSAALADLWRSMNEGGFNGALMHKIPRFNGGLFKDIDPIALTRDQIKLLIEAAKADWRFVEPAIFGTLLERALDPRERHKLGAHYTPRAYVERLVMPTLIDPLRSEWQTVQVAAETWLQQGKPDKALGELTDFHHRLCQTRVLDPACGSANFLYVSLEHMKRLEGEVLNLIRDLSSGQASLDTEGLTVDPHQFLGLEVNPRAAAIAEIVLWIGYLQWHFRIHGKLDLPEPILKDFHNIECRDALIDFDAREPMTDEHGQPVTIWDGISYKESPTTGELIPDESGRTTVYRYINPTKAEWPEADYIVGNPPFIGASTMRRALGDGYVDAVRKVYKGAVPESADFVMHWWHIAAEKVRQGEVNRFGFITTNSLRQTFNRRVLEPHLNDNKKPLSLLFAIPDHPWVDGNDGAAVRIAMTVGGAGEQAGALRHVISESGDEENVRAVQLDTRQGKLFADLAVGANVAAVVPLHANSNISQRGLELGGKAFSVTPDEALLLGLNKYEGIKKHLKRFRNGKDLNQRPRDRYLIDLYGLSEGSAKARFPEIYQWLFERVKPERANNRNRILRERWWLHRGSREDLRRALRGLPEYIATAYVSKHRMFVKLPIDIAPDDGLIAIAVSQNSVLGCLSSRLHVLWSLATGGRMGVGNDPRYNKTRCFETFPFPDLDTETAATVADLAEKLDAHRKRQQSEHQDLTLTGIYNILEKIRSEEPLNAKEKAIHQKGLVSLLGELHDDLDRTVFAAYGWDDLADTLVGRPGATTPLPDKPAEQAEAEEELLTRLVDLNTRRAAEEARGHVRWLRPDYQTPGATQTGADLEQAKETAPVAATPEKKPTFPKDMAKQIEAIREALATGPQDTETLAARFKRKPVKAVTQVVNALEALGLIHKEHGHWQTG
ncbi:DNA methyltransferase [Guyparkeria sp. GHLCS8-2]|uniref:class I SAM-dependent DNA methyltransferase n=1 Tax=Guyparkeria halopsychrophila TaxID=3139421 RepID=UPI0037CA8618